MVIRQGDVCWVDFGESSGSGPSFRRPCVVVQNNVFNSSPIHTVMVCAVTSNLDRARSPGNVLLNKGEGGLPKKSVVNVTQVYTVDKSDLESKLGNLAPSRTREVLMGIHLVIDPRNID